MDFNTHNPKMLAKRAPPVATTTFRLILKSFKLFRVKSKNTKNLDPEVVSQDVTVEAYRGSTHVFHVVSLTVLTRAWTRRIINQVAKFLDPRFRPVEKALWLSDNAKIVNEFSELCQTLEIGKS